MTELILIIITLILIVITLITLITLYIKNKNNKTTTIDNLDTNGISLSINKELGTINETLNTKFNNFKDDVNKNNEVNKDKIGALNKDVNDSLKEIKDNIHNFKVDINKDLNEYKDASKKEIESSYLKLLELVTTQLKDINEKVDKKLGEGFKTNSESLEKVNLSLGNLVKAQENLDKLSGEVNSLNNVLTNSQTRGRFGEVILESILLNVFGETKGLYDTQYVIKNKSRDVKPDAVIFLPEPDNLLCIDSKFSFVEYKKLIESKDEDPVLKQTFRNELKAQITKINEDYIIPNKTSVYAIMFIPNDGIYTYLLTDDYFYKQVIEFARQKNVIITSPSTLQPILANVRMLKVNYDISKNIKNVLVEIKKIGEENDRFIKRWNTVSNNIDTLRKSKDELSITVNKLHKKTENIVTNAAKDQLIDVNEIEDLDNKKDED